MIPIRYQRGVELPEMGLWLDPHDPKPFAFVSHAHSDHLGAHREVIVSRGTSALMKLRQGGERIEHVLEYGQAAEIRGVRISLLPAGHIFGSAQSFIEADSGTLLYTGDLKLRHGLSAEPAEWRQADTLIMETTYGLPKYAMPPTEETLARMVDFCRAAHEENAVPVLLGYSLGKSQEILCALLAAGLVPMLHGSVWSLTEIYRELMPGFPVGYVRYDAAEVAGKVLVCPPSAVRTRMVTQIRERRVAVLTGWALDQGATYRYRCDAAFPLSDHADYPDLIRYVELVKPKRVLTLHGFAAEFARDLRERGIEAWALTEDNQLEFAMPSRPAAKPARAAEETATLPPADLAGPVAFARFARVAEEIGSTMSKLRKTALLSEYLRSLPEDSLPHAAIFLTGRAFAQSDPRVLQAGWALIRRAVVAVSGIGEARFREISRAHADAGRAAFEALIGKSSDGSWSLAACAAFLIALAAARGPAAKAELLQRTLVGLSAREASFLVRILTGDLRIGLKESLVEEAIAEAFSAEADAVREANMLLGDLGETATLAARGTLESASLRFYRPVKVMLASPQPTAEAIIESVHGPAWAEDKFDGIRAQIHIGPGRIEIFTRDLRAVTAQFHDLVRGVAGFEHSAILDGEILAFSPDRRLTFFDLQKRLGRKTEDDLFLGAGDVPVIFRVFDLLWLDGESLLRVPLAERRARLEALPMHGPMRLAEKFTFANADDLEALFTTARERGNEGLIIKEAASLYTPGRRGAAWLKFKKELATLDVVVIGAEQGHGKRSHVLSDYTFAVRDDTTGALLTIGKAYSGLTDDEIETLTEHFTATTIAKHGRYREVRPEIVLEIAFDSIQPSQRHASGLAMRFPRIKAIRRDKTAAEIDTLGYAQSLVA